ncbi:MAG: aminoacyl-tRNA hydrolase, partial [Anaerolineales bacterium]|nr:aminoacyl-tRNA hydrolase [Anaerolineales bacterium]
MTDTHLDKLFETLRGITQRSKPVEIPQDKLSGETYLIVGLGNPGRDYKVTRHNIGFMMVDVLANRLKVDFTRTQSKTLITTGHYLGYKIILAKPQTYMNKSGHAVGALIKFYKLEPDHILMAYDDVDLPFASISV